MSSAIGLKVRETGRRLMLSNHTLEVYSNMTTARQAQFLIEFFEHELAYRNENKKRRLKNQAFFPSVKSFEGFDWSGVSLPKSVTKDDITGCGFILRRENLICYGPVGTGKTHLSIAVGRAACDLGLKVRFITASELVLKLMAARDGGTLDKVLHEYGAYDLTVLDEWGYVPIDKEGSRLLFQVVSRCYETKSLMLTTNLEFSKWGSVLTEEQMATAMIDRLLHHGHVITFSGESYRIRHAVMKLEGGKDE
ncbi:MAG: IS21-like element helper ATPase IstB [Coriobacteriales bacterium]|jgi:DNA replication protein DnaC|nr:IS21-like element helper ATPase IstB [Coriobacteriales bacterium]